MQLEKQDSTVVTGDKITHRALHKDSRKFSLSGHPKERLACLEISGFHKNKGELGNWDLEGRVSFPLLILENGR